MTAPSVQLISAILADDSSKIKSLLERGVVNVNDRLFSELPPLLRAALYGKPRALKALLDCGADRNITDKRGLTALQLAQKYNHPEIVEILLQN